MTPEAATERPSSARTRSLLIAVAAFALYGSWAFAVNLSHGAGAAVKALLTQGASSFVSTFTITMVMEAAYGSRGAPALRSVRAFAAGCAVMYSLTLGLHLLMGTPELLATVAPVLGLGTIYCGAYSAGLGRLRAATS